VRVPNAPPFSCPDSGAHFIEPIFGQLKQVLGFRQFSLRGLASMRGEWRLMATVHHLLKLWRHYRSVGMAA
jgi:hypothetical protein